MAKISGKRPLAASLFKNKKDRERAAALDGIARAAMADSLTLPLREKGYIYYHGRRVAGLALWLLDRAQAKNVNRFLLYAAGLFHDVGKGREQHAKAGAAMIPVLLEELCTGPELAEIARLVAAHNSRGKPNRSRKDEQILQDADTLDHFGAQNVWLGVYFSSRLGAENPQGALLQYLSGPEQAEYIRRGREGLNCEAARKEFKKRLDYQRAFTRRLEEEAAHGFLAPLALPQPEPQTPSVVSATSSTRKKPAVKESVKHV